MYKENVAIYVILLKEVDFNLFPSEAPHRDTALPDSSKIFTISSKGP